MRQFLLGALGSLLLLSSALFAQARPSRRLDCPLLVISTIQDAGGLTNQREEGQLMNLRFTEGVARYLKARERVSETLAPDFCVVQRDSNGQLVTFEQKEPVSTLKAVFLIEGRLSYHEAMQERAAGYSCTLELRREEKGEKPLVSWLGTAQSLLLLSGNVQGYSNVNREGLIGELGDRILGALLSFAPPLSEQEQALILEKGLKEGEREKGITIKLIATPPSEENTPRKLLPGTQYHMRLETALAGQVFVLERSRQGLRLLLPSNSLLVTAKPKTALLLPAMGGFLVERAEEEEDRELIVLLHSEKRGREPQVKQQRFGLLNPPRSMEESPVQVREVSAQKGLQSTSLINATRLLQGLRADTGGQWIARRLVYHVSP